ncbi:MAG: ATP-binding cassette domain-containing protein [Clostridia bacterium]|nr:ATP-binding cassette domain-containing protein [Clostridia bacterium]
MVIAIIGENCAGKSTLAEAIKKELGGEVITGKDYLRMAKSEAEAEKLFREKLQNTAAAEENIIYVISEKEHIALLPKGAVRVLVHCDLSLIKERFRVRMRGTLPPPVEKMLENKHGAFDGGEYEYRFDSGGEDAAEFAKKLSTELKK